MHNHIRLLDESAKVLIDKGRTPSYCNFGFTNKFIKSYDNFNEQKKEILTQYFLINTKSTTVKDLGENEFNYINGLYDYFGLGDIPESKTLRVSQWAFSGIISNQRKLIRDNEQFANVTLKVFARYKFHVNEGRKNILLYMIRLSIHEETYLHIFEENLDFVTESDLLKYRLQGKFIDKPYISVPIHSIRSEILEEEISLLKRHLGDISDKEKKLLQELREAEQKNWTEVTARIKANEFNSIISKRLASKDELKNIHKIGEKEHFGQLDDVQIVHGKIVSANISKKTRFDKTNYNSID